MLMYISRRSFIKSTPTLDMRWHVGAFDLSEVVKSSLRSVAGAMATPLSVLAVGVGALARHPGTGSAVFLVMIGTVLMAIAAFDYPLMSRSTDRGLERRCVARRHLIPWGSVAAVESVRHATVAITTGGRRYLLAAGKSAPTPQLTLPAGVAVRTDRRRSGRRTSPA